MEHDFIIITSSRLVNSTNFPIKWFVDSLNGSDCDDGRSTNTPLKTIAEMNRRQSKTNIISRNVIINIMTDLPATDPIKFTSTISKDTTVTFNGLWQHKPKVYIG